jgi:hypothetical protein
LELSCLMMLYLVAKPSHMGFDVDRVSLHLHCPTAFGCQTRGQSPLTDIVLLYLAAKLLPRVMPPMPVHTLSLSGWAQSLRISTAISNHSVWGGAGFRPLLPEEEGPPERSTLL